MRVKLGGVRIFFNPLEYENVLGCCLLKLYLEIERRRPTIRDMSVPNSARFNGLGLSYEASRPSYPPELVSYLTSQYGLTHKSRIADVGSGTGKLSALFLEAGLSVSAIEPNSEFRMLSDSRLGRHSAYTSYPGTAEAIPLPDRHLHFISVAQAFHWFDMRAFRQECRRVLRPGGSVALIWNDRRMDTPFLQEYEAFLQTYSSDYQRIHSNMINEPRIRAFFVPAMMQVKYFSYTQRLSEKGLVNRYRSCSYALKPEHPNFQEAMQKLSEMFHTFQRKGEVHMDYTVYCYSAQFPE